MGATVHNRTIHVNVPTYVQRPTSQRPNVQRPAQLHSDFEAIHIIEFLTSETLDMLTLDLRSYYSIIEIRISATIDLIELWNPAAIKV